MRNYAVSGALRRGGERRRAITLSRLCAQADRRLWLRPPRARWRGPSRTSNARPGQSQPITGRAGTPFGDAARPSHRRPYALFAPQRLRSSAELAYLLPRPTTQKTDPAKAMWPPRVVAQELRIRADGSDQPADDVKCWVCYGGTVAIHVASRFNTTAGHEGGAGKRDDFYVLSNVSSGATRGLQEEDAAATTTDAAAGLDEPMVMMTPWEGAASPPAASTRRCKSCTPWHAASSAAERLE